MHLCYTVAINKYRMRIFETLLVEYDRQRTADVVGDGLWKAYLKDEISEAYHQTWRVPLNSLQSLTVSEIGSTYEDLLKSVFASQELQKKWTLDCLDELESADPTPNKKYMLWLARQYAKGITRMEDMRSTVKEYLVKFNKLGAKKMLKPEDTDLNRYPTPNALYTRMDTYPNPVKVEDAGTSHVAYEDEHVSVIVPDDEAAAVYYGKETRWCTATTSSFNYYTQYSNDGPLYILVPKNPKHAGEKYQLHFPSDQYMDENDEPVELRKLLTKRFPNLLDFFRTEEHLKVQQRILFADDKVIENIVEQTKALVQDIIMDIMTDWETGDDYYPTWLRDNGYVDEEGDIDWERAPSYFQYNDEAESYFDKINDALDMSADEVRAQSAETGQNNINEIPEVMADHLEAAFDRGWRTRMHAPASLVTFLNRKIIVDRGKDENWVAVVAKPRAKP